MNIKLVDIYDSKRPVNYVEEFYNLSTTLNFAVLRPVPYNLCL